MKCTFSTKWVFSILFVRLILFVINIAENACKLFRVSPLQEGSQLSVFCSEIKTLSFLQGLHMATLLLVKNQWAESWAGELSRGSTQEGLD